MSDELRLCPFCGHAPRRAPNAMQFVCCNNHMCVLNKGASDVWFSVDRWGNRPGEDSLVARAERAEAAKAERDALSAKLAECHKQMDEMEDTISNTIAERDAAAARAEAAEVARAEGETKIRYLERELGRVETYWRERL